MLNRFRNFKIAYFAQKCKRNFCHFGVSHKVCLIRSVSLRKFGRFDILTVRNNPMFFRASAEKAKKSAFPKKFIKRVLHFAQKSVIVGL